MVATTQVKRKRSGSVSGQGSKPTISKDVLINVLMKNGNPITSESDQETQEQYSENEKSDTIYEEDEESEDDENENDGDEKEADAHKSKKQKTNMNAKDIQIARETAELFRSNIFKLQIDELVKEVKLNESKIKGVEKFLHKLYDAIQDIKETDKLGLDKINAIFSKTTKHPKFQRINVPFADPKPVNINYKLQYLKPKDISLVGSFGLKNGIQLPFNNIVDLNVTMPNELFEKKDYLNYRAFHKRSFYLAYITRELLNSVGTNLSFLKFHYEYVNNDMLTPSLRIDCVANDVDNELNFHKSKFSIRLIASFPFDAFDFKKLLPDKNNIRIQLPNEEDDQLPPTPIYNASLITNSTYDHYLKLLYKTKKQVENFHDACVLGRLWLLQRGFKSGSFSHGGFGHFEFAVLMALLLKGGGLDGNKILLSGFSSYQLFKGTVKYLATVDIAEHGYLSFHSNESIANHVKYSTDGFHVPAIFDKTTKLNILWKMSIASYQLIKHEAQITLNLLNNDTKDTFDAIFLKKNDIPYLKYDLNIELPIPAPKHSKDEKISADNGTIEFNAGEKITFISYENFIKNRLYTILKTGLQDKLKNLSIKIVDHSVKDYKQVSGVQTTVHKRKHELNLSTSKIHIGLILNQQESEKLVIRGPPNSDTEAGEEFDQFWGEKASLRKFKDSSIHHCVIWEASAHEPTVFSVVKYLFSLHLDYFVSSKVQTTCGYFQSKIPLPTLPSATKTSVVNVNSYNNLKTSFENFYKVLMNLNDKLPLKIKTLLPNGSAFRYTSVLAPVPFAVSNPEFFQDVVLEFESSKNWPDQIQALENTKTAFLLKIYDLLKESKSSEHYHVFIERDDISVPYNHDITTLNVITPEGFGFRVRVLTERDEVLYLRANSNVSKDKRSVLEEVYLKFNQKYIGSIKHTRSVSTLAHHFLYLSPVIRLFKRWLDDQLLLSHLNDELVELIALKVFVDSESWLPPSSAQSGFLRILQFLATWNWKEVPLVLDLTKKLDKELEGSEYEFLNTLHNDTGADFAKLSDKMSLPLHHTLVSNFEKVRGSDPQGMRTQYFIGTKDDQSGILWGSHVHLPIATRLTVLARIAISLMETQGINEKTVDMLFKPALDDYDFVIRTKGPESSSIREFSGIHSASAYKNLSSLQSHFNSSGGLIEDALVMKLDPMTELMRQLNDRYGNIILFSSHEISGLHNKGENVITGIFYPNAIGVKSFKVNMGYNCQPVDGKENDVVINKKAIYDDICKLGGDLIHNLFVKKI
ncbi:rRNA-processing protein [Saccharomycopsis crataegensis]|uniref:U3 small nucleolar RNA-associated protein 22 n=1 Tax=Saccharomycopsis crataegensis TaxID=43959 RepID=A0AAV5QNL5_9ASCO|nr:rRNA-processing protein [Saccharomycopsis crataegensis]